jgi:hypothetical protein
MLSTRRLLIVVGISLCAFVSTGCEPVEPTSKVGQIWLVDETYSPADAAVRARMNKTIQEMQFEGLEFKDVVQLIREIGEVNIHVKWCALEQIGVTKSTKVSVDLRNVTAAKALRVILEKVGGVTKMGYLIDEGVITISTKDDLSLYTFTRVYDVNDLIKPNPLDKALPRKTIHPTTRTSRGSTNSGSGSGSGWDDDDWDDDDDDDDDWERIHDLMEIIRTTIEPDSWRGGDSSGDIGSVKALDGKLIVTHTKPVHRRIVRLLSAMRGQTPTLPARKKSAPTRIRSE